MNIKLRLITVAMVLTSSAAWAQTFTATGDATIKSKYKSTNYGTSSSLEVDTSPLMSGLLKFSVSGVSGSISSAKVRLYVTDSSSSGPEIYQTSTSWSEGTVTWDSQPAVISSKLDDRGSISSGKYIEYNVASVVNGNGEYSFLLKGDSSNGADLSSRETSRPPQLIIVADTTTTQPPPPSSYIDDTHSTLTSGITVATLSGNHGYNRYQYETSADGKALALDTRQAVFNVANSKNSNPTYDFDCSEGTLPVNMYPLNVYSADLTAIVGGYINSLVPLQSDWEPTYHGSLASCNSAAIHYKYASGGTVDGVRITGAWDAVRMAVDSPNLVLKNSWISDVRDDILENDYLYSAVVKDTLVDGTFQGISLRSTDSSAPDASSKVVTISGAVIRIQNYLYKGNQYFGALFKGSTVAPSNKIHNSVIAVSAAPGSATWNSYWSLTWSKTIECSNNVFLWMSDAPIPSALTLPPSSCFKIYKGQEAINIWNNAKTNWINCHPKVLRKATDPVSDVSQCQAGTYGGYTD